MVTIASTPTASARSAMARTSAGVRAPQASRWVWESINGVSGTGGGGAARSDREVPTATP